MAIQLDDLMQWPEIEALEYAECDQPEQVLGARMADKSHVLITAFFPEADKVSVRVKDKKKEYNMTKMDEEGYFAVLIPERKIPEYLFLIKMGKEIIERLDSYSIESQIDSMDMSQFNHGVHDTIYEKLGAHPMTIQGVSGTYFAVWAPNARAVSVVGDFNQWDNRLHPMKKLADAGIYELFIPGVGCGELYKYEILGNTGKRVMKADPFGNYAEKRPHTASIVWDLERYSWQDKDWMEARKKWKMKREPMLIYEVALGSFRKPPVEDEEEKEAFCNYREIATLLCDYCLEMGYTHVELLPVMEHPLDGSWGYQVTGYYAPTSRYGTPEDFMYFVDYLHQHGIGVILDWVPAHFPKDEHGLARFDGTCLFEHLDPRQGEHPHWGTLIYNYGRPQVANFLIANALFWLEKFHADGLRMDAVASMLYLDYGKNDGEWVANMYGGHENLEAIDFLQKLNKKIHARKDGSLSIAEESTAWSMVTGDVSKGGLGFDLKWNMGWMNDFLEYMRTDPLFRKGRHGMLTFSMMYQYSEEYILVLSHDEVVHMKGSMYTKMPGSPADKFASLRLSYGYMAAHPGKKLLFMGQEFGQEREWSEERSLDWNLLEPTEDGMSENEKLRQYVSILNQFYRLHPAMYREDSRPAGFEWISTLDADRSVIAFLRKCKDETLLVLCNFTPVAHEKFRVGVPFVGKYKEIFNSDAEEYGGTGFTNPRLKQSKRVKWDGRLNSIECRLAPLSIQIFNCTKENKKKTDRAK
ncbi:MAG: 1,4-alpha-glucan branching protein GlgB [Lachnospiraceae bacterium]|nr:1,4-alpha-glucan branching protein GlgB [Lachnospiraceae bacterium]